MVEFRQTSEAGSWPPARAGWPQPVKQSRPREPDTSQVRKVPHTMLWIPISLEEYSFTQGYWAAWGGLLG